MGTLIAALIGLMVFSYCTFAGIGYVKISVFEEITQEFNITKGIMVTSSAIASYDLDQSEYPSSISDLTNGNYMDDTNLFSSNISLFEFSSSSYSSFYYCFGGDAVTDSEYNAFETLASGKYEGKLSLVSDCDTGTVADAPETYPASLVFRYDYN